MFDPLASVRDLVDRAEALRVESAAVRAKCANVIRLARTLRDESQLRRRTAHKDHFLPTKPI